MSYLVAAGPVEAALPRVEDRLGAHSTLRKELGVGQLRRTLASCQSLRKLGDGLARRLPAAHGIGENDRWVAATPRIGSSLDRPTQEPGVPEGEHER